MAPLIAGGLIKAAGGLLGGLFGKDAPKPSSMIISHMKGIREGAERYGFNPLAWAGTSPTAGQAPPNYMGAAISDAFASVADAYSQNAAEKAEADQLRQENEELRAAARMETIRPTMPGLYGRPSGVSVALRGQNGVGWTSAYDAPEEWGIGPQVKQPGTDGMYEARLPEKTAIMTPLGETTPASISDAEAWEKRYGDPVSWIVGVGNLASDAGTSLRSFTDARGITTPGENLLTETLPRKMWHGLDTWNAWSKREAKKGGTGNRGFGRQSDAYEGWMTSTFGEGHIN